MSDAITIHCGEDESWTMAVNDANGQPIADLSGYSVRMQVRASVVAATPVLDLSTDNGAIARGTGAITIAVAAADSAAITLAGGVYDVQVTDPLGKVRYTPAQPASVTFIPAVTR